jgi:SAM-dependent methyltransferase
MTDGPKESWGAGGPYERYVGRWSRVVAREFCAWLGVAPASAWVDVGCGTGALVATILGRCAPGSVIGIDRAEGFVTEARRLVTDSRARFEIGDATNLPLAAATCDATVSGLVLNFIDPPAAMGREMARVTRPGGVVAAYVWDYAGGMEMIRHFWEAAVAVRPGDAKLAQGERFPICHPERLAALWESLGLGRVATTAIDIPTVFRDFEDYWTPFLGKQGTAPTYLATLDAETRERIRALLASRLVPVSGGPIALTARAWAVQGLA